MSEQDREPDIIIEQGEPGAFPTGSDVAGPGTVRRGSGYSGTTSGGIEPGTGHDPSPYDPPSEGYQGSTTAPDDPEIVIDIGAGD